MAEVVTYEGQAGLMAIAHALNDVRRKFRRQRSGSSTRPASSAA